MESDELDIEYIKSTLRELDAIDPVTIALWAAGYVVVLVLAVLLLRYADKKLTAYFAKKKRPQWWDWPSRFFDASQRRKITKAADGVRKSADAYRSELEAYKTAVEALVDADLSNGADLREALDNFKSAAGKFALPKLAPERFEKILPLTKIHKNHEDLYTSVLSRAAFLEGFTTNYKGFFVRVNGDYLEYIEQLVASQYHDASIKSNSEYLMQKNIMKDAEKANKYFSSFILFVYGNLKVTEELIQNLDEVLDNNKYWKLWMRMD